MGLAAVALRTDKDRRSFWLRPSAAARLVMVAAGAELVADKTARIGDRLGPGRHEKYPIGWWRGPKMVWP